MTISQEGQFYAGIVGFPLRINLVDDAGGAVIGGGNDIPIDEILSGELVVKRPDATTFTRTLSMPGSIVGTAFEYLFQDGDVPVGGRYHYTLTLSLTDSREFPVSGSFTIGRVDPDS